MYFPCLSLADMGIVETMNDGKKMACAMKKIIEKFPSMNAIATGMDLTVDAEAFGSTVTFKGNEAPSIREPLVDSAEEVRALKVPDVHSGRVDVFLEAVKEAGKLISDRPVLGGQLGPFSLAANLMEVQKALKATRKDPDTIKLLLDKATEFLIARAKAYKEAGANGIFLAEPTAGLLSPKQHREFSAVYVKKIVEAVQDSGFYIILHNCGYVTNMVPDMIDTGCKGFHFGNAVDMREILSQIPPEVLVYGNIDPSSDFTNGTAEGIYKKTTELLRSMEEYPHFILSSGCDIPPLAPMKNIEAFFRAHQDYTRASQNG
ncbi:MAG: uroporphyrinogen decarboxylase family protein [Clostridia bacterium]